MPDGPPAAWLVAVLGLWVLASPFVFGVGGTFTTVLVVSGIVVAALGAFRGMKTDDEVPLPALPLAVIVFGLVTIGSPFLFAQNALGIHGITLIVSGVVFLVIPAVMINQVIKEEHATAT